MFNPPFYRFIIPSQLFLHMNKYQKQLAQNKLFRISLNIIFSLSNIYSLYFCKYLKWLSNVIIFENLFWHFFISFCVERFRNGSDSCLPVSTLWVYLGVSSPCLAPLISDLHGALLPLRQRFSALPLPVFFSPSLDFGVKVM